MTPPLPLLLPPDEDDEKKAALSLSRQRRCHCQAAAMAVPQQVLTISVSGRANGFCANGCCCCDASPCSQTWPQESLSLALSPSFSLFASLANISNLTRASPIVLECGQNDKRFRERSVEEFAYLHLFEPPSLRRNRQHNYRRPAANIATALPLLAIGGQLRADPMNPRSSLVTRLRSRRPLGGRILATVRFESAESAQRTEAFNNNNYGLPRFPRLARQTIAAAMQAGRAAEREREDWTFWSQQSNKYVQRALLLNLRLRLPLPPTPTPKYLALQPLRNFNRQTDILMGNSRLCSLEHR